MKINEHSANAELSAQYICIEVRGHGTGGGGGGGGTAPVTTACPEDRGVGKARQNTEKEKEISVIIAALIVHDTVTIDSSMAEVIVYQLWHTLTQP